MATTKKKDAQAARTKITPAQRAAAKKKLAKMSNAGKSRRVGRIVKVAKARAKKLNEAASKKKLGGAKAKPAAKKVAKATKDHWFAKLSKKQQTEYIKAHPNSKYAKNAKAAVAAKGSSKGKVNEKVLKIAERAQAQMLKRDHTKALKLEQKLAKKVSAQVTKLESAKKAHAAIPGKRLLGPKAKTHLKLANAKDSLLALRAQHREAKKKVADSKKALKPAAKKKAITKSVTTKKPAKKITSKPSKRDSSLTKTVKEEMKRLVTKARAEPSKPKRAAIMKRYAKARAILEGNAPAKKTAKKASAKKDSYTVTGKRVSKNGSLMKMRPSAIPKGAKVTVKKPVTKVNSHKKPARLMKKKK